MTKFVHDKHEHVYYLSKDWSRYTLKSFSKGAPVTSISLDESGHQNFLRMLKDGGWYEQSTKR